MPKTTSRAAPVPVLAFAAVLLPGLAAAFEIYTWVDEEGVVHYSESRPEEPAATPVETLHLASTNSPGYDPDDDYWSILNQAERIGDRWSALRQDKAEEEALARAAAAEARIADLERQLAAHEAAEYAAPRPFYGPFAFFPKRHRTLVPRGIHSRPGEHPHRPPHTDRDLTIPARDPRPGWTPPKPPARPPQPGFAR